jgi:hypothetical protein
MNNPRPIGRNANDDVLSSPEFAIANRLKGRQEGVAVGYDNGREDGYQDGYSAGHADGHAQGWQEGIDRGNVEISKQMAYTRAHIADKESLQREVEELKRTVAQLHAQIAQMKQPQAGQVAQSPLPAIADELRAHNEQLRAQVQAISEKFEAKNAEFIESTWQLNRATAMANAMRNTLTVLMADKQSERTHDIERTFCEEYKKEVARGIEKGSLQLPLDEDAVFARTMPATHRFLTSILESVGERIELERTAQRQAAEDDGNWVPDGF